MDREQKRFEAAKAALTGILANEHASKSAANQGMGPDAYADDVAACAVYSVDALLTALSAPAPEQVMEGECTNENCKTILHATLDKVRELTIERDALRESIGAALGRLHGLGMQAPGLVIQARKELSAALTPAASQAE